MPRERPRVAPGAHAARYAARCALPAGSRRAAGLCRERRRARPRRLRAPARGNVIGGEQHKRFGLGLALAAAGLAVLVAWSFGVGRFPVSVADVWRVLWSAMTGGESGAAANVEAVVLQIRGPRIAGAVAVGAALAAAGAAYQGLFK